MKKNQEISFFQCCTRTLGIIGTTPAEGLSEDDFFKFAVDVFTNEWKQRSKQSEIALKVGHSINY